MNANIIAADDNHQIRRQRRNTFGVIETIGPGDHDSVDVPQTLSIRKDPPASSTVASVPRKQPKCGTRPRPRPCAGDFDELTQAVLDAAIGEYRAIICTQDPFPDAISNQEISAQVWVNACASLDIQIQPTLEIMKLVCFYSRATLNDLKLSFIYR
jgi:hypothetical protein